MNLKAICLGMLILMSTYLSGQSTLTITVYGNCGMCQDRIENAAKNVIGVNTANWDDSTLKLVVSYQEGLFEEDDLHSELVAAVPPLAGCCMATTTTLIAR